MVTELWGLILSEGWWNVGFESVEDFTAGSGIAESVARVAEEQEATRRAKRRYGEVAAKRWDCADLRTLLGLELMPLRVSKSFLEMMTTLAGKVPDAEEAVELLRAARDKRLKMPRAIKDSPLQPHDVNVVLQRLGVGKRVGAIRESIVESMEGRTVELTVQLTAESTEESIAESMAGLTLESTVESTSESQRRSQQLRSRWMMTWGAGRLDVDVERPRLRWRF